MTLKTSNTSLQALIALSKAQNGGALPVDNWHPEFCGEMDMVIKRDGSWLHEGTRITRAPLIKTVFYCPSQGRRRRDLFSHAR